MVTLYTTPLSANGRKVLAVSQHLGLTPDVRLVNVYQGEGRSPEFLALNPSGKIPVLVDGEFTLYESNAILQYLCEAHAGYRLWSRETKARAHIVRWLFWESAHWQPVLTALLSAFVAHRLLPELVPPPLAPVDWDDERLQPLLGTLERDLRARPFLTGETVTIADFSVAGMITYFRSAQFPFEKTPGLSRWYACIEALEAWRSTEAPLWRAPPPEMRPPGA
jgi:glutathione S-transferase